jgi:hypothetical protein
MEKGYSRTKAKEAEAIRANTEATHAEEEAKRVQREAIRLAFQQATTLSDQGEVGSAMHVLAPGGHHPQGGRLQQDPLGGAGAWHPGEHHGELQAPGPPVPRPSPAAVAGR